MEAIEGVHFIQDDFREEAPKKWFRLAPGAEVRLRGAALVTCQEIIKDASGTVVELRCTWDPASKGGNAPDGRKVKGTIHWVSARHALDAEVRIYEQLFLADDPMDVPEGQDWHQGINPASLEIVTAKVEPGLAEAKPGERFQFERTGYFAVDLDSKPGALVFNRTVGLNVGHLAGIHLVNEQGHFLPVLRRFVGFSSRL